MLASAVTTITMQNQSSAFGPFLGQSGTIYTPDANGFIGVKPVDVAGALDAGFVVSPAAWSTFRNILDGGDFSINPWQRNVAALATAGVLNADIANTVTYFPDRFFAVGGASSAIKLAKVANVEVPGFTQACKWSRKSANSDVAAINFGQVCETADSIRLAGRSVTFSFWAKKGANFSPAALRVRLFAGTSADDTAANMIAGSWAGSTTPIDDSTTTAAVLTTAMQRLSFTGSVPAGTTQVGVLLTVTPVGTAGADDSITLEGLQLDDGIQATPFEHRDVQVELEICQRYYWAIAEPAAGVIVGTGHVSASNVELFYLATPVQLRAAPTVAVTVGTFKARSATAGVVAATGLAGNATHTVNAVGLTSTGTGTAGQGATLEGGGGAGIVQVSADY